MEKELDYTEAKMDGRKQDQLGVPQMFRVVLQFGGVNQGVSRENSK